MTRHSKKFRLKAINEILSQEIIVKYHPDFEQPNLLNRRFPDRRAYQKECKRILTIIPPNVELHMRPTYAKPLLSADQEKYLFIRFNYLKHLANQTKQQINPEAIDLKLDWQRTKKIKNLLKSASLIHNHLTLANLRLTSIIIKRFYNSGMPVEDICSYTYHNIWHAVIHFDIARGNKFSTYATWVCHKNLYRIFDNDKKHKERYQTWDSLPEQGEYQDFTEIDKVIDNPFLKNSEMILEKIASLSEANHRRMAVIKQRFGIGGPPMILAEIGKNMKVCKERIRQLEIEGLNLLRQELGVPVQVLRRA